MCRWPRAISDLNVKSLLTCAFVDYRTTCNAQRTTDLHRRIKHSP
jgi:hypothetical protein